MIVGLVLVLAAGAAIWFAGVHGAGTLIMLLAVGLGVTALVVIAGMTAAGLPRPRPFAERNLLTARVASAGKALSAAIVLAVGGYLGAIIAADISSPTLNTPGRMFGYLTFAIVMLITATGYLVVLPVAILMGIELLRVGPSGRRESLRKSVSTRLLDARWIEHLSSPAYAIAALVGLTAVVPLTVAVIFWTVASSGLWA